MTVLKTLPANSVDCVVTSPPYWQLRDYGVDGQLGLETNFEEYIRKVCDVFDEVKRVLKPTGTCWVNLGDTFVSEGMRNKGFNERWHGKKYQPDKQAETDQQRPIRPRIELPEKSLTLIPFRFAIEMINRGWILRNTVIWHKPNCIPASVTDRFTVDFEYLFFFTKSKRYWFEAQHEPFNPSTKRRVVAFRQNNERFDPARHKHDGTTQNPYEVLERIATNGLNPLGRNKRCVWTIATQPFKGAHFATFPEKLIETPMRAGCPGFICNKCGKAKERIFETSYDWHTSGKTRGEKQRAGVGASIPGHAVKRVTQNGWRQCGCNVGFCAGIVLDPFFGTGTVGVVARKLRRRFLGIELNRAYIQLAEERLAKTDGLKA